MLILKNLNITKSLSSLMSRFSFMRVYRKIFNVYFFLIQIVSFKIMFPDCLRWNIYFAERGLWYVKYILRKNNL